MTSCFFYKLNAETAEFESVSFDKEETCLAEFKELIIKNKFENNIGLKELDVIDYNSRKKFSDKDVLKNNSYFIVSKIPKLTLSTKNTSSQVATIQPYITSEVSKIETPKTNYSYEHPTSFTTSTVFTNKPENTPDPLYCYSQPQQMIVINPHHQPYHLHHSQPPTYIYSAPEGYIQPALYPPHVYPTPLAIYPPYFPHLSNPIYPSHQFSQLISEKEGRPVDKFYESHHKRSPRRMKAAYSSHRHEKVHDKISRHRKHSSRYGSQRDRRRRSDSRRRERRRSHSRHHRREHKYHRNSRDRHYSREKKSSKGRKYSKEKKKEDRNHSRHDKEFKEIKGKMSKDSTNKCQKQSVDDDRTCEEKSNCNINSCSDDNSDEDDDSNKLKSVLSKSAGGLTECDKKMLEKIEDTKEDERSLTEKSVGCCTRNIDQADAQKVGDKDEHERCKDGCVSNKKNCITNTNSDKTLINKQELSSDCVDKVNFNGHKKVDQDVKYEDKETNDQMEKEFTNDNEKKRNISATKQHKQSQRKEDLYENENKTYSIEDTKNIASFGTRKTQIRTVSNQLSLNI